MERIDRKSLLLINTSYVRGTAQYPIGVRIDHPGASVKIFFTAMGTQAIATVVNANGPDHFAGDAVLGAGFGPWETWPAGVPGETKNFSRSESGGRIIVVPVCRAFS